ncbi:unnamed protein product [Pylaiella littoralis]
MTHPSLSGLKGKEAHFFDWSWPVASKKKDSREWPGDEHQNDRLSPQAVGSILSAYADKCMTSVKKSDRDKMLTVDSTPLYAFYPLAPYRMKMVLPRAKLIIVVRDPTERYFSHLRMTMCWTKREEAFEAFEKKEHTFFHTPGEAKAYLEEGGAAYEPYTPLCRGEKATSGDLKRCSSSTQKYNPLYRGLYADQLERWFRVYDRTQILVVESSEMFGDFKGTLDAAARHAGLPQHEFEYDPRHQHSSETCQTNRPELFAEGGRYDKMLEDKAALQEWYRPHNQRLYELLGREMPWA